MSRSTMHTALGAVACALTLAVFLAFSGSLPESVPMQFSLTGEASTYWPRGAVVFGVPAAFTASTASPKTAPSPCCKTATRTTGSASPTS